MTERKFMTEEKSTAAANITRGQMIQLLNRMWPGNIRRSSPARATNFTAAGEKSGCGRNQD
jgi:hypothetical protein